MSNMKSQPTPGQFLLFYLATIQLAVCGIYVLAALSNGIDGHEMLPYWANVLLLNGAADLFAVLVWMGWSSGGGGGKRQSSTINPASANVSTLRALP